ncbi:MAG: HesA/MoeB/ThiF family protein [Bacteroidota bacterium]
MDELELTTQEQNQYSRHIMLDNIGLEGQLKMKNAKVLVVGAGGLGSPVLQYLAAAGVGTIGIADNDVVADSNIARQVLFARDEVGLQKAIIASKKITKYNPYVKCNIHNIFLTDERVLKIIDSYDIVVDATDNLPTRYLLNDACIMRDKVMVHASLYKFQGMVSVFNFQNGPSYRCLFPFPPRSSKILESGLVGVLGTLVGVIGSIQAGEVIKIITGFGEVLSGKVFVYDMNDNTSYKYDLNRIDENFEIDGLIDYEEYCKPSI